MSLFRAVWVALMLGLAAPAAASADATLSVSGTALHKVLTYTVDDAQSHVMRAYLDGTDLVVADPRGVAVGSSGCSAIDVQTADCGPAAEFDLAVFVFGGGADQLGLDVSFPIPVHAEGGGGDDILLGGVRDDQLAGGPGNDDLYGSPGNDQLVGGDGDDYLNGDVGADSYDGGDGEDEVWAEDFPPTAAEAISCGSSYDVVRHDELDRIASDCELTDRPALQGDLRITGSARVGTTLGLSLPINDGGDGDTTFQWERCDAAMVRCDDIDGADASTYTPTGSDLGRRLRARYIVENDLGVDWAVSEPTDVVEPPRAPAALPELPVHRHTLPFARPALPGFVALRKPAFVVRNGDPTVDTGRSVSCFGPADAGPCKLRATASPSGASAHWPKSPPVAGTVSRLIARGATAKVMVTLNLRAYRLLRVHRKLTLTVSAKSTRSYYAAATTTFTIAIKLPPRRRR
jgi:RTX calcium-binding nonapeptide repeat (4 copies)